MIPDDLKKRAKALLSGLIVDEIEEEAPSDESNSLLSDLELLLQPSKKVKTTDKTSSELRRFLNLTGNSIGFEFWKVFGGEFPKLFEIFKKLRTIQPTSASVERLFSRAKLMYGDLSGKMDVETIFYNIVMYE